MKRVPTLLASMFALSLASTGCGREEAAQQDTAPAEEGPVTVATGFNGPMGVAIEADGTLWVSDSGTGGDETVVFPDPETGQPADMPFGQTARLVRIDPDGTRTDVAMLPSFVMGTEAIGTGHITLMDGTLYVTSGAWGEGTDAERLPNMASVLRVDDDGVTEVAETWSLERDQNPERAHLETHPYGPKAGPDGRLWLADAAGNTLLSIDPMSGDVELVATFDVLPSPVANPARGDAMETEPVPTNVAFAGGATYVSLLPGAPFAPGSGKVVRVADDGSVSDYATGFTMLTDLQTGPDGSLYAVSMAQTGEQGPTPGSGSVIRVAPGTSSEVVLSGLSFPTALAFAANGDAYVTINGVGAPGSGEVVRYPGLAAGM